jgi:hypothetical protein
MFCRTHTLHFWYRTAFKVQGCTTDGLDKNILNKDFAYNFPDFLTPCAASLLCRLAHVPYSYWASLTTRYEIVFDILASRVAEDAVFPECAALALMVAGLERPASGCTVA